MSSSRVSLMRIGCSAGVRSGASCARVALLISFASLVLGGCGTTVPAPTGGLFGAVMAGIAEPERRPAPPVDMEADGLEAQRPPPLRMHSQPDDPTQPFSPNYGSVPVAPTADSEDAPPAPA